MAATRTANGNFLIPAVKDRNWNVQLSAALTELDASAPMGQFNAYPTTIDVSGNALSLSLTVSAGKYLTKSGTVASFTSAAVTVTASTTTLVWVDQTSNALATGSSFPSTACVRIASVVANGTVITSVTDARVLYQAIGT